MNLGQFIEKKRKEKNYTMEELGEIIGKNKAYISRLENNKVRTLKHDMMGPLAKALDVPLIELFSKFDSNGDEICLLTEDEFIQEVLVLLQNTDFNDDKKQQINDFLLKLKEDNLNKKNYANENIKYLRDLKGISQYQLAKDLNIDRFTIAKWETNKVKITLEWAIILSNYFDIEIGKFVSERLQDSYKNK